MSKKFQMQPMSGEVPPRYSEWRRFRRVFLGRQVVKFGAVIILLLIMVAIFAPLIAPYDPYEIDLAQALLQPSSEHWLGTDLFGRDELSRLIFGSRVSLQVGIIAIGFSAAAGMILGLLAGYFGGWVNTIIMRLIDAWMAIPPLVLSVAVAAALGGGLRNIMIAISAAMVPPYCRLMCGQVLSVKQSDYIMASHVTGASNLRIMRLHIIPNCFPPLIVLITLNLGIAILAEAALSFLGLGIAPPGAAWGAMVSDGYQHLLTNPLLAFAPGLCIMLVVIAFNMVGDGLRDALDPTLRGAI